MFCFHYKEAIFKYKMETLVFNLKLLLNKDIEYECEEEASCHEFIKIGQTNLKFFNFEEEDKTKIISYFKNNGFIYTPTPGLKDRLIFKYVTCCF